jgi:hypothetical protein
MSILYIYCTITHSSSRELRWKKLSSSVLERCVKLISFSERESRGERGVESGIGIDIGIDFLYHGDDG